MTDPLQEYIELKINKFYLQEAEWLDGVVRKHIHSGINLIKIWLSTGKQHFIKRSGHWFIDQVYVARILKIKITRNKNQSLLGKGFRNQKIKLDSIKTTVYKKGKEVDNKVFTLNIIQ